MTPHEEQVFRAAFERAAATAEKWPAPALAEANPDEDRGAAVGITGADRRPEPRGSASDTEHQGSPRDDETNPRWINPRWLVAAGIALVLLMTSGILIQRYLNAPIAPAGPGTARPATAIPATGQSPCLRVPAFATQGRLPDSVDRIWLCGAGWDQTPLVGPAAADTLAQLKSLGGGSDAPCAGVGLQWAEVFFEEGGTLQGYRLTSDSCWSYDFDGVNAAAMREALMDAFSSGAGKQQQPRSDAANPCLSTNFRPFSSTITGVAVCTDSSGQPLAQARWLSDPGLSAIRTGSRSGRVDSPPEGPGAISSWVSLRVIDQTHTDVWYLIGDTVWFYNGGVWKPDAATVKQIRALADNPTATGESRPPLTSASPCSRVPALSPLGALPTSADRIWLCGDGWDQVSLDGDEAAAVLAALDLVRPTNSEGCSEYSAAPPMRVYFDTGPQRRGYTIGGTCPLASRELATLEAAFKRAHGAPQFPALAADICQTTSMSPRAITHISVVAVCTDSTGAPLASGRRLPQPGLLDQTQLDELTGPIAQALLPIVDPDVQMPTRSDGPADMNRWVVLRVSDGTSVDTWYLVGDQIWVSGYPRAFHARPSALTAKMLWEVADRA